ncbi:MAG: LytTR family transcriptional regulator [Clostridiales bacterium]|nr:LytTR family transcriptional regulator [Clostridiales bacterium]
MQVEFKIDPSCAEPKIVVLAAGMTEEIEALLEKLSEQTMRVIAGQKEGKLEILDPIELIRVFAQGGKVFASTRRGEYALRMRLYELEERLDSRRFARISNSEIINLGEVRSFDLSIAGTICVQMKNGEVAYVSRRYVSKIKKILGL